MQWDWLSVKIVEVFRKIKNNLSMGFDKLFLWLVVYASKELSIIVIACH